MEEIKLENSWKPIEYDLYENEWKVNGHIRRAGWLSIVCIKIKADNIKIHNLFSKNAYIETADGEKYDITYNEFLPHNLIKKYLSEDNVDKVLEYLDENNINDSCEFYEFNNTNFSEMGISFKDRRAILSVIENINGVITLPGNEY